MYRLSCLGEATLRAPSGQLIHFRSRKHFALLTYLALNADRAHRRERLAGLLWSDGADSRARHSLSQALYAVRRLLDGAVRIEGEDLEFRPDRLEVDVLELERSYRTGDAARAAELYRGEFLEGFWVRRARGFEEWAARERARVGALARDAIREAVKAARDRCDWGEVRSQAARLLELDEFDEGTCAELMRALWMMGDRAAALERYQTLKDTLAAELQTQPSPETQALASRIRKRPVRGSWHSQRVLREIVQPRFEDPPFVGRMHELTALAREYNRVAAGESRTLTLVGGAGIGKTRLAEQFIGGLELDDVNILRSRCYEAERSLPYGSVAEAFRRGIDSLDLSDVKPHWIAELARIVPEVRERFDRLPQPAQLDPEGGRRRLYEGIAQVLISACEMRPTVWFIDDLQWADDSSLSLLHYLQRRVTSGLFLLTSHRPEELGRDARLSASGLLSVRDPGITTIRLGGLDSSESSELLQNLIGEQADQSRVVTLQRMSAGNPFFAIELARSLTQGDQLRDRQRLSVPNSIRSLFDRRFAGLSERALSLLQQAALLGSRVGRDVLQAAAGFSPFELEAAIRELGHAALIEGTDGLVNFRHDLIREVAAEQIPVSLRGVLHLKAARALIRSGGDAGEIALHFSAADESKRAYGYALRGADAAERIYALEEAADLLTLAIRHAPHAVARLDLVGRLGKLYLHTREYEKARPLLEERLRYIEGAAKSRVETFEARRDLLFLNVYSAATTVEESGEALKTLHTELVEAGVDAPALEAQVLGVLFWAAARSFNPVLVEETIQRIRGLHERSEQPSVRCRTARSLGIYECYKGDLELAEQLLNDALRWAQEAEDEAAVLDSYIGQTALLLRVMDIDMARRILRTALPLAEQHADPAKVTAFLCNCAVCHMYHRDNERAEYLLSRARQTIETAGDIPDSSPSIFYNLGFVAFTRGDYKSSETHWNRALEASTNSGVLPIQEECLAALGQLAFERGEVQEARSLAARALRLARRGGILVDERFGLQVLLAKLRYKAGRPDKALHRLEEHLEVGRIADIPLYLTLQLTRLEILAKQGKQAEAAKVKAELCAVASEREAVWWIEESDRALSRGGHRPSVAQTSGL